MSALGRSLSAGLALLLLVTAGPAIADPMPAPQAGSGEVGARARASFLRGVELYEERDFGGAGVEFRRAYELVPNFRILFNLGRVAVELHDYAASVDLFVRYLSEGGDQVPPERRREIGQEIEHLKPRVGQIKIVADDVDAEVYLDDVSVGRTPLAPLTVNVGRHRLEIRPRQGEAQFHVVDAPGQETVVVRIARYSLRTPSLRPIEPVREDMLGQQRGGPSRQERVASRPLWLGWTATALCAMGAGVFGIMAYRSSKDLSELRATYPVRRDTLDSKQKETRALSAVADGLLGGAAVFGGLSLYFSFNHEPKRNDAKIGVSLGWPSIVSLKGHF